MYWVALAAFVVKDIVEAFRYDRDGVLNGGWKNWLRTSSLSSVTAELYSDASPYEHAHRVYAALAKGNLWLFMDIYPWLWFFLEYGVKPDGTLNTALLKDHVSKRDAATLQQQSRQAVEDLPFNANWLDRLKARMTADPVYTKAASCFRTEPLWSGMDGGYGAFTASAHAAHAYVRANVKNYDAGYRSPPSPYWSRFEEAFYVMEEERRELKRIVDDTGALAKLKRVARFTVTPEVEEAYDLLMQQPSASGQKARIQLQQKELNVVAKQEQLNILQRHRRGTGRGLQRWSPSKSN